jgi:GH24 family phage-related lysozyme (muramidase)
MDGHRYTALFEAPDGKPILKAYPDPKTKKAPWTIGLGHTGKGVGPDTIWTEDQCWAAFYSDYATAFAEAAHLAGTSCWAALNEQRRSVLTDMAFQMGGDGLAGFTHMLAAIKVGHWDLAQTHMLNSAYAKQTPSRAQKNGNTLLTGEWPSA